MFHRLVSRDRNHLLTVVIARIFVLATAVLSAAETSPAASTGPVAAAAPPQVEPADPNLKPEPKKTDSDPKPDPKATDSNPAPDPKKADPSSKPEPKTTDSKPAPDPKSADPHSTPDPKGTNSSPTPDPKKTDPKPELDLKTFVTLVGVTDNAANNALSIAGTVGHPLSLILVVKKPIPDLKSGELRVLPFTSNDQPPATVTATVRTTGSESEFVSIAVNKLDQIPFHVKFVQLLPGKTYKGRLIFTAIGMNQHTWDVTLTTGTMGTLAVDAVGTLKFTTLPPITSIYEWWTQDSLKSFSITVHDKSGGGPYENLNVRFESSAPASSKDTKSNFNMDSLSFWETNPISCNPKPRVRDQPIDLEQRQACNNGVTLKGVRTFTSRIAGLSPGEYSGTLRFNADGAVMDAADAKLPLVIQVKHHWLIAVLIILLGSAIGWYSSKYIVGSRQAAILSRTVADLRARADFLARPAPGRKGWSFPAEAGSLGLARLSVELSRLARLSESTVDVLFHADEIEQTRKRTELRLMALESLQKARLDVQPIADLRPAAQLAIGRLLRSANNVLELSQFGETEQTNLNRVLTEIRKWSDAATSAAAYQQAVLDRLNGPECPTQEDLNGVQTLPIYGPLKQLFDDLDQVTITPQMSLTKLRNADWKIARIALLWRECKLDWTAMLNGQDVTKLAPEHLFHDVDEVFWESLKHLEPERKLRIVNPSSELVNPQIYKVVELKLTSTNDGFDDQILIHPLKVVWNIQPPSGGPRVMETSGLKLVQYFPESGNVDISATLWWGNNSIKIDQPLTLIVEQNSDYGNHGLVSPGKTEFSAIGIAALFAIVTALVTQYDSTFGTMTQYLNLFVWAAGAGGGGNLFSQLGPTSVPGGASAILK